MKKMHPAYKQPCLKGHHKFIQDKNFADLPRVVDQLMKSMQREDSPDHVGFPIIPSQESLIEIAQLIETLMFPGYFGKQELDFDNVRYYIGETVNRLYAVLNTQIFKCFQHECRGQAPYCRNCLESARTTSIEFLNRLPELRGMLSGDVDAAFAGDPAAKSVEEIIFSYPGLKAISIYRFAHVLHELQVPILPRMLTEYAHTITGCDIHPGARIGPNFFIDHATGVVIGETSIIGANVRLYQGVTLGGIRFPRDESGQLIRDQKRHPTIEDDVVIYANATILGGDTIVGKGSVIGGNVWLTHSVPPGTRLAVEPEHQRISKVRPAKSGKGGTRGTRGARGKDGR
jgi:serine O-acetyltransferase